MATQHRHLSSTRTDPAVYYAAVDRAAQRYHLGGFLMFRSIKALTQLAIVAFGIYLFSIGDLTGPYAFGALLALYLGPEVAEQYLANSELSDVKEALTNAASNADADGGATITVSTDDDDTDSTTGTDADTTADTRDDTQSQRHPNRASSQSHSSSGSE